MCHWSISMIDGLQCGIPAHMMSQHCGMHALGALMCRMNLFPVARLFISALQKPSNAVGSSVELACSCLMSWWWAVALSCCTALCQPVSHTHDTGDACKSPWSCSQQMMLLDIQLTWCTLLYLDCACPRSLIPRDAGLNQSASLNGFPNERFLSHLKTEALIQKNPQREITSKSFDSHWNDPLGGDWVEIDVPYFRTTVGTKTLVP